MYKRQTLESAAASFEIKGELAHFTTGEQVTVTVSPGPGGFALSLTGGDGVTLPYELRIAPESEAVPSGGAVAVFSKNGASTASVYCVASAPARYAGSYTGTLTFTSTVKSLSLIHI